MNTVDYGHLARPAGRGRPALHEQDWQMEIEQ